MRANVVSIAGAPARARRRVPDSGIGLRHSSRRFAEHTSQVRGGRLAGSRDVLRRPGALPARCSASCDRGSLTPGGSPPRRRRAQPARRSFISTHGFLRSRRERRDRSDVDAIWPLAGATRRSHHDQGRRLAMLAGVHAVREAQQPGSSLVYGALAHLDLHCGPSAAGKGVDLSGKARTARRFEIPIVTEQSFAEMLGLC